MTWIWRDVSELLFSVKLMWPSRETYVNACDWYKIFHGRGTPLPTRHCFVVYRNHDMVFFNACIKGKICSNLRASIQICFFLSHCIIIIIMSVSVMDGCESTDTYRRRAFCELWLWLAQSSTGAKPSCLLGAVFLKAILWSSCCSL